MQEEREKQERFHFRDANVDCVKVAEWGKDLETTFKGSRKGRCLCFSGPEVGDTIL